jgi:hypothetical protein
MIDFVLTNVASEYTCLDFAHEFAYYYLVNAFKISIPTIVLMKIL